MVVEGNLVGTIIPAGMTLTIKIRIEESSVGEMEILRCSHL